MTELLKPVISTFAVRGNIVTGIEEEPDYRKAPKKEFEASPSSGSRNKAKAKRKGKKKKNRH